MNRVFSLLVGDLSEQELDDLDDMIMQRRDDIAKAKIRQHYERYNWVIDDVTHPELGSNIMVLPLKTVSYWESAFKYNADPSCECYFLHYRNFEFDYSLSYFSILLGGQVIYQDGRNPIPESVFSAPLYYIGFDIDNLYEIDDEPVYGAYAFQPKLHLHKSGGKYVWNNCTADLPDYMRAHCDFAFVPGYISFRKDDVQNIEYSDNGKHKFATRYCGLYVKCKAGLRVRCISSEGIPIFAL